MKGKETGEIGVDVNLFKQNVTRLLSDIETVECLRLNGHAKHDLNLGRAIQNAKVKADWLLSELEILEGEQLLQKVTAKESAHRVD